MTPEQRIEMLEREVKALRGRLSVLEVIQVRIAENQAAKKRKLWLRKQV